MKAECGLGLDHAAAEHLLAFVEYGGLAGRDTALGNAED